METWMCVQVMRIEIERLGCNLTVCEKVQSTSEQFWTLTITILLFSLFVSA